MDFVKVRQGTVEWREVEGEIVAIDLRRSLYFALNRTGALLWPQIVEGATRDSLVTRIAETFRVPREQAEQDLARFVESLREQDLLEPSGAPT